MVTHNQRRSLLGIKSKSQLCQPTKNGPIASVPLLYPTFIIIRYILRYFKKKGEFQIKKNNSKPDQRPADLQPRCFEKTHHIVLCSRTPRLHGNGKSMVISSVRIRNWSQHILLIISPAHQIHTLVRRYWWKSVGPAPKVHEISPHLVLYKTNIVHHVYIVPIQIGRCLLHNTPS